MKRTVVLVAALAASVWCVPALGESETDKRIEQIVKMLHRVPQGVKRIPPKHRETVEQRRDRMTTIARAIVDVAEKEHGWLARKTATAAIYTIWYHESRFGREVHIGGLSRWGSDSGKARCLGQLWEYSRLPNDKWRALAGVDYESTRRCASATLERFRLAAGQCGWVGNEHRWRDAFRNYGTGAADCAVPIKTEAKRVKMAESLSRRLL